MYEISTDKERTVSKLEANISTVGDPIFIQKALSKTFFLVTLQVSGIPISLWPHRLQAQQHQQWDSGHASLDPLLQ